MIFLLQQMKCSHSMHVFVLKYEDKSSTILSLLSTEVSVLPGSAVIQSQMK